MKKAVNLWVGSLLLFGFMVAGIGFAQDDDAPSDSESTESTTQVNETVVEPSAEEPDTDSADAETASNATMERFDPSEKISEDRSVSFPVDI